MVDLESPVGVGVQWRPQVSFGEGFGTHVALVDGALRELIGIGEWIVTDARERVTFADGLADALAAAARQRGSTAAFRPVSAARASESVIVLSVTSPFEIRIPLARAGGMLHVSGERVSRFVETLAAQSEHVRVRGHDRNCGLYARLSGVHDSRFYNWAFSLDSDEVAACSGYLDQPGFTMVPVGAGLACIWSGSVGEFWLGSGVEAQRAMIGRILPPVSLKSYHAVGQDRLRYLQGRVADVDLRDPTI